MNVTDISDLPEQIQQWIADNREETVVAVGSYTRECRRCGVTEYEIDFQPASNTVDMAYVDEEGDETQYWTLEDTSSEFFHIAFRSIGEDNGPYAICEHCVSDLLRYPSDGKEVYTVFEDSSRNIVTTRDGYVDTRFPWSQGEVDDWDNEYSGERNDVIAGEIPDGWASYEYPRDILSDVAEGLIEGDLYGLTAIVMESTVVVPEKDTKLLQRLTAACEESVSLEAAVECVGGIGFKSEPAAE